MINFLPYFILSIKADVTLSVTLALDPPLCSLAANWVDTAEKSTT